jgi:hypothetical protein
VHKRRSQRVVLRIRVIVHGQSPQKRPFEEETSTLVVNAHGALIELGTEVEPGQSLLLQNRVTEDKQECRVAHLGEKEGTRTQVGIEFARPAPHFWHIDFPPADWEPLPD